MANKQSLASELAARRCFRRAVWGVPRVRLSGTAAGPFNWPAPDFELIGGMERIRRRVLADAGAPWVGFAGEGPCVALVVHRVPPLDRQLRPAANAAIGAAPRRYLPSTPRGRSHYLRR